MHTRTHTHGVGQAGSGLLDLALAHPSKGEIQVSTCVETLYLRRLGVALESEDKSEQADPPPACELLGKSPFHRSVPSPSSPSLQLCRLSPGRGGAGGGAASPGELTQSPGGRPMFSCQMEPLPNLSLLPAGQQSPEDPCPLHPTLSPWAGALVKESPGAEAFAPFGP